MAVKAILPFNFVLNLNLTYKRKSTIYSKHNTINSMPCATTFTYQYITDIFKTVQLALPGNNDITHVTSIAARLMLDHKFVLLYRLQQLSECSFSKSLQQSICSVLSKREFRQTFEKAPNFVMAMIATFLRTTCEVDEQRRSMRDAVNIASAIGLNFPTANQWMTFLEFSQYWIDEINNEVSISDLLQSPDLFDSKEEYNSLLETLKGLI